MTMHRHGPIRLVASLKLAALVLPAVIVPTLTARAGPSAAATIRALTGRTTRIVWVRGTGGKGDAFGPREGSLQPIYRIVALDTDDGGKERYLVPEGGTNSRPLITPSGTRVVWSDCDRNIWVIDWEGGNKRQLLKAEVAVGVAEDPLGTEWVYVAEGTGGGEGYASIVRYQIDDPRKKEVAWDKARSIDKWEISRDGSFGASRYPATVGSVTLPNGEFLPVAQYGCTPGISGDGTTVMHMITVSHAGIYLYNRDGSGKRMINFGNGPSSEGLRRAEYWWAAFARYDGRFITFGGPFTKLGGYPGNIYFCQLNDKRNGIAHWVRVTDDNELNTHAYAWIGDPKKAPTIAAQPRDQQVDEGQTATFTVTGRGSPAVSYQWHRDGAAIAKATESSYDVTGSRDTNGATFHCVLTNSEGKAKSRAATLTVNLKGPGPEETAAWEAKLVAFVKESLQAGKKPALKPDSRRNRREVVSVDHRGAFSIEVSPGMQVGMPVAKLSPNEKVNLVVSVLRENQPADHCLVAFYLYLAGKDEEAERHLAKGGKGAAAVRALFQ